MLNTRLLVCWRIRHASLGPKEFIHSFELWNGFSSCGHNAASGGMKSSDEGELISLFMPTPFLASTPLASSILTNIEALWIKRAMYHYRATDRSNVSRPYEEITVNFFSAWMGIVAHRSYFQTHSLQWHHNGHDSVSNHHPHDCLLNRLFRRRSKKTSKLRVTGLCVGNSPGPVNSPHKGPVKRKMFPFDDVIMLYRIRPQSSLTHCNGTIWRHRYWSTMAQIMACCPTAPSHYLNQCWPGIINIHSSEMTENMHKIYLQI